MALIPLQIPAGVYKNGTDYQGAGRWIDSNLVRWTDGTMRPVGGWQDKTSSALDEIARGMHAWQDNSGDKYIAVGTYNELYVYDGDGNQYDITPAGIGAGQEVATPATGYGIYTYGTGNYGTERPDTGLTVPATIWQMDNWGEYLVACSSSDGKLYEWQLDTITPTPAAVISNAPISNSGVLVTEERFLFALGASGNPRKIAWSDREDNTTWTAASTNEAGDIELETQGEIRFGVKIKGRTLIITSTDAHAATYIGPPYVYGFERVGSGCGAICKRAGAAMLNGAVWMGNRNFFMFDGAVVTKLNSDVSDYVFGNVNKDYASHIFCVPNSRYSEVWWFYVSSNSTEVDSYVSYNYIEGTWAIGRLSRTCGVDQGVFANPVWFDPDTFIIKEHESGYTHGTDTPYAETGPIAIGTGDQVMIVTGMIPDEKTQGQVEATFKTRFHPNDTEREYGAYDMGNPTSVRFTGRQVRMRVTATGNDDWRVGTMRLEAKPGGKR
jgi:hypothetical protein